MKKLVVLAALFLIIISDCSKQGELTRIDIERYNEDRVFTIMDRTTINTIKSTLAHVKWSPNVEVKMARREDVAITLFYQFDKNMPERLYTHKIWFNSDSTATIISDNEKQGFGTLNKYHAPALKVALFQHGEEEKAEGISLYKLGEESEQSIISDKDAVETINKNSLNLR